MKRKEDKYRKMKKEMSMRAIETIKSFESEHRKRRGGTAPNRALSKKPMKDESREVVVISKHDFDEMKNALGFAWHEMNVKISNVEGTDIPKELRAKWGEDFEKWFDLYQKMNCVVSTKVDFSPKYVYPQYK